MIDTGRLREFFYRTLWQVELSTLPRGRRALVQTARMTFVLLRELWKGDLGLRAMSLVYTTLLSLVPLLAVSFSVLKAFGVHNQVEPVLRNFLAPLGPEGVELSQRIISFVSHMKVGVLGAVGLLFLFYTVITLIQKIEESFNFVWRIQRERPFSRRFSDYLSVITIGPVLVFSAIGLTASVTSHAFVQQMLDIKALGPVLLVAGRLLPYFIVIAAFTFVYVLIPNTRVRLRSALVGGVVAGVLWQTTGMLFAEFIAGSAQYAAIYSGFAIVLLFMIWLYVSWLILLFGSQIAYYHQHPQQVRLGTGRFVLSGRLKEHTGLAIMYLVTERYMHGGEPWSADALVLRLKLPGEGVEDALRVLVRRGFLVEMGPEDAPGYLPARDPDSITALDVIEALRSAEEDTYTVESFRLDVPAVAALLGQASACVQPALSRVSLRALVKSGSADLTPVEQNI